jgi:lipopolysaccharide transport system ATP-binding protein
MKPILEVKGISKRYKIHHEDKLPYLSLRDSIVNIFKGNRNDSDEEFSALKDVSFDVYPGESIGIIGRNGAGKSTLLKIMSKITPPSSGKIICRGRVASLLEVGTGFHMELTGRENIFLNGSILGLKRKEIIKQFDAIIDFSGVEKFLDTPLKNYSSGMQLRLAFSVAAHLEPEILIIDEVLAVGDDEFQKKCIKKMDEVSKSGRTIIFVSHNMGAVKKLCSKAILLSKGEVYFNGDVHSGINTYMDGLSVINVNQIHFDKKQNSEISFLSIKILNINSENTSSISYDQSFFVILEFEVFEEIENVEISICLKNRNGVNVIFTSLSEKFNNTLLNFKPGIYSSKVEITGNFLIPGDYYVSAYAHLRNIRNIDFYEDILKISIIETGSHLAPYGKGINNFACVFTKANWNLN